MNEMLQSRRIDENQENKHDAINSNQQELSGPISCDNKRSLGRVKHGRAASTTSTTSTTINRRARFSLSSCATHTDSIWRGITSRIRDSIGSVLGVGMIEQPNAVRDEELDQDNKLQLVAAGVAVGLPPQMKRKEEHADELTEHELRRNGRTLVFGAGGWKMASGCGDCKRHVNVTMRFVCLC